ncbi:hypothetical protein [Pseudomonas sp. Hg5Tf]|uniref:Uncharacterized protein n=1 Tax=Pseudomonas sp. Hg7Tf TaxID=3236988 RepID=A0AB39HVH9_9PSED|nr:hypothetical protein [Pseudomonas sp. Hg5Tf]MDH2559026.1 hypothetical protein [Pseudomonas sp. Hg5Tf]
MGLRGGLAITILSVFLIMALAGLSRVAPKEIRLFIAVLFFPGFFVVIMLSLRIAEGRIRNLADVVAGTKEGGNAFLAWSACFFAVVAVSGLIALISSL